MMKKKKLARNRLGNEWLSSAEAQSFYIKTWR